MRKCTHCNIEKPLTSFYTKNKTSLTSYCKSCLNTQVKIKQRNFKQKYVDYKGGCCSSCGYNKCLGALEFHHLDPNEKDFEISQSRYKNEDEIKAELAKCILLCSNCHRETHYDYTLEQVSYNKIYTETLLENIITCLKNQEQLKDICIKFNINYDGCLSFLHSKKISVKDFKVYNSKYPSKEILEKLVWEKPSSEIAKDLGISDVALSKHCKKHGIEKPPRGHWSKV